MKSDRVTSAAFILVSVWFLAETKHLQYNCAIFPRFSALLLIVLSIVLFIETFLKQKQLSGQKLVLTKRNLMYVIVIVLLTFVWVYSMNILGFVTSSIVFLTLITLILDPETIKFRKFLSALVLHTIIVIIFWFALAKLLLVPLPRGFLM